MKMLGTKRTIGRQVTYVGTHVIAELFDCKKLGDADQIERVLLDAAHRCGATVLHSKFHRFEPQGLTGYILLAESHISIHTWPEYGYAAVDAFTFGTMDPSYAVRLIAEGVAAQESNTRVVKRGGELPQSVLAAHPYGVVA